MQSLTNKRQFVLQRYMQCMYKIIMLLLFKLYTLDIRRVGINAKEVYSLQILYLCGAALN